jgi:Tfp pilus assembly protein FimT
MRMMNRNIFMPTRARCRSGFTFAELMMGIVVTSLVTLALAAFSYATAQSWRRSENGQSLYMAANQTAARMTQIMTAARQVGLVRAGSIDGTATGAAVMLWKADTNSDGKISFSEVAMIQHDPSTHEIKYYEANPPTAADDYLMSTSFISGSTAPESFRALTYVTGKKLSRNVLGAVFTVASSGSHTQRPIFEFGLKFTRDVQSSTLYGSAAMRSIDQATN